MILISVDDHIVEPPDMFKNHLQKKYLDEAPRLVHNPDGSDTWQFRDVVIPNVALNAVAGRPKEEYGLDRSCCAENDEPPVELGVRCLWVVCFGYCMVMGMVAPRSWNAWRWVSVASASMGTVLSVPAKWTWLRVRVPRWVSSPW